MKASSKRLVIACVLGLLVCSIVLFSVASPIGWFAAKTVDTVHGPAASSDAADERRTVNRSKPLSEALGVKEGDMISVGGILRPKRDIAFAAAKSSEAGKSVFRNSGHTPFLRGNENSQVAGLMQEVRVGKPDKDQRQSRRAAKSSLFQDEPFDLKQYRKAPLQYLEKIRPGRVYRPAAPGPDVTRLTSQSPLFRKVIQGESVTLRVAAAPGMPVAFHTGQTGTFSNLLKSITVAADVDGVASAQFKLGKGSVGLVDVLAASPVHSGQVNYTFKVMLPAAAE